ncbi:MAG: hypothetical protein RLZZ488_1893 [Pseudomonadota bacterium]|jgi:fused signal recognition particle receptor
MSEQFQQILLLVGVIAVVGVAAFLIGRRSARRHSAQLPPSAEPSTRESATVLPVEHDEKSVSGAAREDVAPVVHAAPPAAPAVSWLSRLSSGLSKTQNQLVRQLDALFTSQSEKASREAILDGMLEVLVRADVGIRTAELLIEKVRHELASSDLSDAQAVKDVLRREMLRLLRIGDEWSLLSTERRPTVVLMVGVNGVGKTTTSGKLAFKERQLGKSVIVGAADTFRAAAVDQLEEWARRAGAECVRLSEGADPASVAFECVKRAVAQQMDLCLIDTAGRLHNRQDLMQELAKIKRVTSRDVAGAPHEVLLVLDATTGQNALQQAKAFREIAGVTGLVLTKLDGTAKGGVAVALAHEMQIPIRYIGVGESVDDLQPFSADEFVDALFAPHSSQMAESTSRSAATGSATF